MTRSMVLRLLCGAWLVPAASLIWIGLATTGLRTISDPSLAMALGRTQALAVTLAVFTVLVGASVGVRQPRHPRPVARPRTDGATAFDGGVDLWFLGHGAALALAIPALLVGVAAESLTPLLWPVAALAGFAAGLVVPRGLLRIPGVWSGPLAALAVGMAFQLTIGWLHVIHPAALASPILIVEGLVLAWAAASAARVEPFAALTPIPAGSMLLAPVARAAAHDPEPQRQRSPAERIPARSGLSSASAPPSFGEQLAGR